MNIDNKILLFDGDCALCNKLVLFVLKNDKSQIIKFASLQSAVGQIFLKKYQLSTNDFSSFVYIKNNKAYVKSTAALHLFKDMKGLWSGLFCFIVVPKSIRDFIYNIIAKNRFKWFGKANSCIIPNIETKNRFLNLPN